MRRFVLIFALCYFILVFFSPFSFAITSLGEERANLSAFRTFVRFAFVWFCLFHLLFGVWEGLRLVIVALPGLFYHLFYCICSSSFLLSVSRVNFVLNLKRTAAPNNLVTAQKLPVTQGIYQEHRPR